MIRIIAAFQIQPEKTQEAIDIAKELVSETRKERGCDQYDLVQSATEPSQIVILEGWATQEALDAHSASEHFTRLVPKLEALSQTPSVISRFTQLA